MYSILQTGRMLSSKFILVLVQNFSSLKMVLSINILGIKIKKYNYGIACDAFVYLG